MKKFSRVSGRAYALPHPNIDTDVIIAAQRLKSIYRTGLGEFAFEKLRTNPDNPFDDERYRDAPILVAGPNFGCGSSREHAVWAMADMGIRTVIASSFGDIFAANAAKNGFLTVTLRQEEVVSLMDAAAAGAVITVDLEDQTVSSHGGESYGFEIEAFQKTCLLEGLDDIELTLKLEDDITSFEGRHRQAAPWLATAAARA
jgi:3-isopropylmalate dehydratase small subunit